MAIVFFLIAAFFWLSVQSITIHGGLNYDGYMFATIYGMLFGFWMVAGVAIIEKITSHYFRKSLQPILFILFSISAFALALLFIWFRPGHPSNKLGLFSWYWAYVVGVPAPVPVLVYLIRNITRS